MSKGKEDDAPAKQKEGEFSLPPPFCSIQASED